MSRQRAQRTHASSAVRRISLIASLFFLSTVIPALGSEALPSPATSLLSDRSLMSVDKSIARLFFLRSSVRLGSKLLCKNYGQACLKNSDCCAGLNCVEMWHECYNK